MQGRVRNPCSSSSFAIAVQRLGHSNVQLRRISPMPRHISRLHLVKHQSQLCLALCRNGRALSEQDLNQTVRAINASQVAADLADTAGGEEIQPSCRRDIAGVDANQTMRSFLQACKCKRSQRGRRSTLPSRPLLWARAARLAMSARRSPTRQAPTCRPCPAMGRKPGRGPGASPPPPSTRRRRSSAVVRKKRKKENRQPKGGMGGRHAATTQGF